MSYYTILISLANEYSQAAFYPGGAYLLSRWYTRKASVIQSARLFVVIRLMLNLQELSFRAALFSAGGLISSAFGSVSVCLSSSIGRYH